MSAEQDAHHVRDARPQFDELLGLHYEALHKGLSSKVRHVYEKWRRPLGRDALDDELQRLFAAICRTRAVYDPARSRFKTWCYHIAARALVDRERDFGRQARRPRVWRQADLPEDGAWEGVLENVCAALDRAGRGGVPDEALERLRRALPLVRPRWRQALRRRYWDGWEYAEIGRELGVAESTARGLVSAGIKELAERLAAARRGAGGGPTGPPAA